MEDRQGGGSVTSGQNLGALRLYHLAAVLRERPAYTPLGCGVDGGLEADHCIRLGTFLTLDDVEVDVIALFQRFVPVQLNRRIVDEYIRPVFASDESIALGVVEPLDLPFVLCHRLLPSLVLRFRSEERRVGEEG